MIQKLKFLTLPPAVDLFFCLLTAPGHSVILSAKHALCNSKIPQNTLQTLVKQSHER